MPASSISLPAPASAQARTARRLRAIPVALRQAILAALLFGLWYGLTELEVLSPFFFGRPLAVMAQVWDWFSTGVIFPHLVTTLIETVLAFAIGTLLGMIVGLWLGLSRETAVLLNPFLNAMNSMPRVVLAPIFAVWFGLGILSKVALGVTLVFFLVFFNVFQGVREVSPVVLANARMMGANRRQLLTTVYIPSATSWVFSSLHASVGMAFVGAVVGEYLGSARGVGYLILQAEGVFDVNAVFAGIVVLTAFAVTLDWCVSLLERRLLVWKPS